MDLTTRCPRCGTVFEASLQDLQLRKGYIRCVQCAHIFDGYAEVVGESSPAAGSPQPGDGSEGADRSETPQVFRPARGVAPAVPPPQPDEFHVGDEAEPIDRPAAHAWRASGFAAVPREPAIRGPEADAVPPPAEPFVSPPAEPFVMEPRPGRRSQGGTAQPLLEPPARRGVFAGIVRLLQHLLLWALVLLLIAQGLYVYRSQIALAVPVLRPWLEQACVPLHCKVPYARDIARISITGSSLKTADAVSVPDAGEALQHFILHVTLRNASGQPQEWPMLILDLKDASGTQLVRRNLSAVDYLGAAAAAQPFPARSEALLRIPLTLSGVRINGYQLDLFFP